MSDTDLAYLDGVDVDTLNLKLTGMPSAFGGLNASYPTLSLPQKHGVTIGRSTPDIGPRLVMIEGHNAVQSTMALADAIVSTLKDSVKDKQTQIRFGHTPTRAYYGVATDFLGTPKYDGRQGTLGWASLRIPFLCDDPYAIDLTPTIVTGIAGERVPVPHGDGPTWCDLYVVGGTNAIVTLRRHDGNPINGSASATTIGWTLTSAAGDYVHIATLDGLKVTKSVSSVITTNMSVLTAGYTAPIYSPREANRALSSWATAETSSGTIILIAKRRWE